MPDVSLVRKAEWTSFVDLCRTGHIPTPKDLFILEPNGDGHSELLSVYVGETRFPSNYALCAPGAFSQVFLAWNVLVQKVDDFDLRAATCICDQLQEMAQSHQIAIDVILSEVRRFIEVGIGALHTPAMFRTYQSGSDKLWWLEPIACLPSIEQFASNARSVELSAAARSIAKPLKSFSGMPTVAKFYHLSAFCLGLAKRRHACADHQAAFLLTYRALDLYFQHLGLSSGTLIEDASGIRHKFRVNRVYLIEVEYELVVEQRLASDIHRRDALVRLNTIRNQLLQTHGAHFISPEGGGLAISEAIKIVSRIEGNSRWKVIAEGFFPKSPEIKGSIFSVLPDIETYLEHVSAI